MKLVLRKFARMKIKNTLQLRFGTRRSVLALLSCLLFSSGFFPARAQDERTLKREREYGQQMLKALKEDIKRYYYDPNFHGMNLDARFKLAQEKINSAPTSGQVQSVVAQVLVDLNDSHTYFLPPYHPLRVDYGWRMKMIGETCYVTAVNPESDAARKGLKVGDVIYSIDGYEPTRENLWKIKYSYNVLKPRAGMRIVVQKPDGQLNEIQLVGKITLFGQDISVDQAKAAQAGKKVNLNDKKNDKKEEKKDEKKEKRKDDTDMPRFYEASKELIICKLPEFILSEDEVDAMMKRIAPYQSLILDLRGNPGGYVKALQRFVGYFFDHDLKIADSKGRKDNKPMVAKSRREQDFKGRLVVLVDGDSASAAEIFARLMQLEKRGTIIGDRTSGRVMKGRMYTHAFEYGLYTLVTPFSVYGASITTADVIMADGKSLENVGVMPDELLLPTGADLAAGRDPVLARAAAVLGFELDAKKAGAILPREQRTEVKTEEESGDEDEPDN